MRAVHLDTDVRGSGFPNADRTAAGHRQHGKTRRHGLLILLAAALVASIGLPAGQALSCSMPTRIEALYPEPPVGMRHHNIIARVEIVAVVPMLRLDAEFHVRILQVIKGTPTDAEYAVNLPTGGCQLTMPHVGQTGYLLGYLLEDGTIQGEPYIAPRH